MYYILIIDDKVHETIPEYDPVFPDIPIQERYAPDFLDRCVTSDMEVPQGWIYDSETGEFSDPVVEGDDG